jgi:lipoprotein-anchoring transpeptidase ErfK/SrfK
MPAGRAWRSTVPLAVGLVWLVYHVPAAQATRFGPPWQARVSPDQTMLYSQPDRGSPPVGPLGKGQVVVVIGEMQGADGTDWTQSPDGYVPSSDVYEDFAPWIAEVSVPRVSIYAKPDAKDAIRRTARQGDLLRVTGVSPGVQGDTSVWWATTEGYVGLSTIQVATSDWAQAWTLPSADDATRGWWGGLKSQANVRVAPSIRAPVVGQLNPGDRVKVLAEEQGDSVAGNSTWYRIDGGRYAGARVHSSLIVRAPEPAASAAPRPAEAPPGPWIVVNRKTSTLTFLNQDGQPQFSTYVSLGRAGVETPDGDYSTMGKYRFDNMTSASVSNADHEYHLPNVPFTQYYRDGGYALHATYWHDRFGAVASQGCINLTWSDGAYLFSQTKPDVAPGDIARWAIGDLPSTPVVIVN